MAYNEGDAVVIKAAGYYENTHATVRAEGEDAEGQTVVIVEVQDPDTGEIVLAGFSPDEVEAGGGE